MIDEAHDLPPWARLELAEQYNKHRFYLILACDPHQRLGLSNPDARVIDGIDFAPKSKRLRQIYRNPTSVYIASLALMFRWFAPTGPKVIPTQSELKDQFGFNVEREGTDYLLRIQNDAHPANSWSHTLARFPDVISAFLALERERLSPSQVLWVRFSEEDPEFDYEQLLQRYTYHNCRSEEANKICDKYIKGQEFSVVVIEGFPRFMDQFHDPKSEERMWQFRRELYLCASRATCFLYLVCNVREAEEIIRIQEEIRAIMDSISCPVGDARGTRIWQMLLRNTTSSRSLSVFDPIDQPSTLSQGKFGRVTAAGDVPMRSEGGDAGASGLQIRHPQRAKDSGAASHKSGVAITPRSVCFAEPIIVRELANALGETAFKLMQELIALDVFVNQNQSVNVDVARKVCEKRGITLEVLPPSSDGDV